MGVFSIILDNIKNMKRAKQFRAMGKEKILALEEYELYEAVYCLCEDTVYDIKADNINHTQLMAYCLLSFEIEVNNGGLCQFFVNSSSECAPFMAEAFDTIGAKELKQLYENFVQENNIDVSDLSSFKITKVDEYEAQTKRYDFDNFDNAFYENEDFHQQIIDYCRENIEEILSE